jgi:uncharacterized membrane protein YphA (DoxX/SURF4 family)
MNISTKLDNCHAEIRNNIWLNYFSVFCRVALAAGFLPSGFVKINGERFTNLPNNQPMGHYLEALFHTGYYYPFIGVLQMTAALLLLIPRTAVLGAVLYLPIILNICILSLAVRFEGSLLTSPLMVLANLYLLGWNYDKIKYILPFKRSTDIKPVERKFPLKFFAVVIAIIAAVVITLPNIFEMMPRNNMKDCLKNCEKSKKPGACQVFCDCIHNQGMPLDKALDNYNQAKK